MRVEAGGGGWRQATTKDNRGGETIMLQEKGKTTIEMGKLHKERCSQMGGRGRGDKK